MGRIGNSWRTVKESWGVLMKDKELALFPVISGIASAIIMATFVVPTAVSGLLARAAKEEEAAMYTVGAIYLVMYFILSFVTIYFNSALIFAASERLKGGNPNIMSGIRGANTRLGGIFAWSLFAATVNLVLQMLQRAMRGQNNFIGQILVGLVGVAWNLATYFVIPVVLFEKKGVFGSLKRSGQLFKQRWGESLVGEYGIGMVFGLMAVLLLVVGFFAASVAFGIAPVLGILVGLTAVLALVLLLVVQMALSAVYRAALYHYAAWGRVPPEFSNEIIANAYHPQRGRI